MSDQVIEITGEIGAEGRIFFLCLAEAFLIFGATGAIEYMDTPNPLHGGNSPVGMIEAGDGEKALASLKAISDGAFL